MCCGHHKSSGQFSKEKSLQKIGLGIVGALVVVAGVYGYWSDRPTAKAALSKYSSEQVAKDKPIRAEHLHVMGIETPIPFLPKGQPQPSIAVSETAYDFGSIGPKDIVKQTFLIRNTGKAPLTIGRAYTTCGCTTADFSASVIPPGKLALVTVTFDAGYHDTRGQTVRRGVIVENNDPNQSKVEIWVTASVRQN